MEVLHACNSSYAIETAGSAHEFRPLLAGLPDAASKVDAWL